MTDRIMGFTVVLDKDYRDDDVEVIANAIRMIKGVQVVEPHVSGIEHGIIEMRLKSNMQQKLYRMAQKVSDWDLSK